MYHFVSCIKHDEKEAAYTDIFFPALQFWTFINCFSRNITHYITSSCQEQCIRVNIQPILLLEHAPKWSFFYA